MKNILIKNASEIVASGSRPKRGKDLRELSVIPDGTISIIDGLIQNAGDSDTEQTRSDKHAKIIDARGKTVIPGFIDAHTHLIFAGTREDEFCKKIEGATYQEIARSGGGIRRTVNQTRKASKAELVETSAHFLQQALQYGTTTMEVKTGYGLDLKTELKMLDVIDELNRVQPVDLIPTFLGAHAVPDNTSKEEYIKQVLKMIPEVAGRARFCDVFCEEGYFTVDESRKILEQAKKYGMTPRLHADQLTNNGGTQLAVEIGARSVDHLEQISDDEIALLASSDTAATLLPGVAFFLNYGYPPARKIIDSGCITALATDFNPGSCMSVSMQMMMSIACTQMRMTPDEALNAATINAAYSLGLDTVGSIEPGNQADLLIVDVPNYKMIPYFFGVNHVETVIKKGEIVWTK